MEIFRGSCCSNIYAISGHQCTFSRIEYQLVHVSDQQLESFEAAHHQDHPRDNCDWWFYDPHCVQHLNSTASYQWQPSIYRRLYLVQPAWRLEPGLCPCPCSFTTDCRSIQSWLVPHVPPSQLAAEQKIDKWGVKYDVLFLMDCSSPGGVWSARQTEIFPVFIICVWPVSPVHMGALSEAVRTSGEMTLLSTFAVNSSKTVWPALSVWDMMENSQHVMSLKHLVIY